MLRALPPHSAGNQRRRERHNSSSNAAASAGERLSRSKQRLQHTLQRGRMLLCLSFAMTLVALNMTFFCKVYVVDRGGGHPNRSDAAAISDAPILNQDVLRRSRFKQQRRGRWNSSSGMKRTELYNITRYDDHIIRSAIEDISQARLRVRGDEVKSKSYEQIRGAAVNSHRTTRTSRKVSSSFHPKVICFVPSIWCDDLYNDEGTIINFIEDSIPVVLPDSKTYDDENNYYTAHNDKGDKCRYPRSFESRTRTYPMCNDIHALGLDDQMFETDYSRGESIDLMTVGGANSVWKTTSNHNGERTILKTSKFLKAYDIDRLELYELDAMVSAVNGNLQLSTLLESKNALAKASSSAWNHIMPLYSHCHSATVTPLASGTLTDYVTNYPSEHGGQTIDPLVKLRLALQVARGLYQTQLYSFGKPTFAHLDLNPSQYLVFHPQQVLISAQNHIDGNVNKNNNIPILQINDFNRGRFLQWDEKNNTCSFQFSGCKKNTRGSRWHAPDRFIGCMDVNEKIDTFTLGGVFFFLLSDGQAPFFNTRQFDYHIKEGELPPLPRSSISDHPAFEALSEITARCRAFRIEDRPTSLEVVGMLEEKLRIIESSSIRRRKEWM